MHQAAVLRVPSALEPGSHNFLLNPLHPDFNRIRIGRPQRFPFDSRLTR
jgi:RES domain-containing protein